MRRAQALLLALALILLPAIWSGLAGGTAALEISGAGATFPLPLLQAWAEAYRQEAGITVTYRATGSGNGLKRIAAGKVDFAVSDIPLDPAEALSADLIQFPLVVGGVVAVANLAGAGGEVRLTGSLLADILAARIGRWDDKAIGRLNPDRPLPPWPIVVVHRADPSGTTFLLTHYLAKVSPAWRQDPGVGSLVRWPGGIEAKGNEGVAASVAATPGAIGYVEYDFAQRGGLVILSLQNREGAYPRPERKSFQAAAANAAWGEGRDFSLLLTDQAGADSWPITGASFVVMRRRPEHPATSLRLHAFLGWVYRDGREIAEDKDYAPVPSGMVARIERDWSALSEPELAAAQKDD